MCTQLYSYRVRYAHGDVNIHTCITPKHIFHYCNQNHLQHFYHTQCRHLYFRFPTVPSIVRRRLLSEQYDMRF